MRFETLYIFLLGASLTLVLTQLGICVVTIHSLIYSSHSSCYLLVPLVSSLTIAVLKLYSQAFYVSWASVSALATTSSIGPTI